MGYTSQSTSSLLRVGWSVWLRTFDFRGRSTRTEALSFVLFNLLVSLALFFLPDGGEFGSQRGNPVFVAALSTAVHFFFLPPLFALLARRLHDIGLPGWPAVPLVVTVTALSFWSSLYFRTGFLIAPLPGWASGLYAAGILLFYAAFLWPPQQSANRFGADPRLEL